MKFKQHLNVQVNLIEFKTENHYKLVAQNSPKLNTKRYIKEKLYHKFPDGYSLINIIPSSIQSTEAMEILQIKYEFKKYKGSYL